MEEASVAAAAAAAAAAGSFSQVFLDSVMVLGTNKLKNGSTLPPHPILHVVTQTSQVTTTTRCPPSSAAAAAAPPPPPQQVFPDEVMVLGTHIFKTAANTSHPPQAHTTDTQNYTLDTVVAAAAAPSCRSFWTV
jgi:hypothetical protein